MPDAHFEIRPVDRITVGALGEPGQRVFYLQAAGAAKRLTLGLEKEQVQMLALSIEQFLNDLQLRFPDLVEADADYEESEMQLEQPLDPVFQVGNIGLGYDDREDRLLLVLRESAGEGEPKEDSSEASLWCTRDQLRRLSHWGLELARRGRPICGNCGRPIDPEGHFCPRKNGHKT
jgi:uncharacterized repeat protein (TIGR03847 family)